MAERCCKTCRYLEVEPNKAGRRVVLSQYTYPCTAPMPELPAIPDSVKINRAFERWRMCGSDGRNCAVWTAI